MNHFFTPYVGNKRSEYKYIKDHLFLKDDIKNIVEPFCGSSALSFNIWLEYGDKFNYYLNDNDEKLINIYNLFQKENSDVLLEKLNILKSTITNKTQYVELCKKQDMNIYEYLIMHKFFNIKPGLYNATMHKNDIKLNKNQLKFIEFICKPYVFISNDDWLIIFNKLNNENTLFLFDPPYLDSDNEFYSDKRSVVVYKYFYENKIDKLKSKICFILEKNWIIDILFGLKTKHNYEKLYQASKRKTTHSLYTNY